MTNEEVLPHASPAPRSPGWTVAAVVVIVVAVVAAYSTSFSGPFIFDDTTAIQKNESIRNLRSIAVLVPPGKTTVARRPLTNLSLAINYAIGELAVRSYHVGNLLIHLLAALALFGIVRRTLLLPALADRFGCASTGLATAVALIWALHPLQTESVTYIVQRAESLMGLCYLFTVYIVIRGASSERPCFWYAAAIAVCALGMGAKEVMATAPIVVLLYDRAFLSGSFREAFRRRGTLYIGLAATWAVLGAIMLLCPGPAGAGFGIKTVTPWRYALTQPGVILHYLGLSFWPQSLCLDYSWPFAKKFWQIAPQATALAGLLAATAWATVRRPALGFLGAWFFLILAPTSSIMPLDDACFEHRMYLSLAAVVAGAVIAAYAIIRQLVRRSALSEKTGTLAAVALTLAVAVALGCATFYRNRDYRTAVSIWEDTAHKRENNARALMSLGGAYIEVHRFDDAMRCLKQAVEFKPDYADAYYDRGIALTLGNDHEGAIREFSQCIALKPDFADAYINRSGEYFKAGCFPEAIQDCTRAIELKPKSFEAYVNRATNYAAVHKYDLALADYSRAIELNASYADAYYSRGLVRTQINDPAGAVRDFDQFISLKPDFAKAYYHRGLALIRANDPAGAIRDLDHFILLEPDFAEAYTSRAGQYCKTNRFAEALQDCNKAIELKPGFVDAYVNRALTQVALHQYDPALSDCNRAIELNAGCAQAWNTRALIYFKLKEYDKAWQDVAAFQQRGGQPNPAFLQALKQASGRTE